MAGLPLYLMAIPLRRSLAAGMTCMSDSVKSYIVKRLQRSADFCTSTAVAQLSG
jgi:hypothetical protein